MSRFTSSSSSMLPRYQQQQPPPATSQQHILPPPHLPPPPPSSMMQITPNQQYHSHSHMQAPHQSYQQQHHKQSITRLSSLGTAMAVTTSNNNPVIVSKGGKNNLVATTSTNASPNAMVAIPQTTMQQQPPSTNPLDSTISTSVAQYKYYLRRKLIHSMNFSWTDSTNPDTQKLRSIFVDFLCQPDDKDYPDLCQLPDLTEQTLFENLKARFKNDYIYTYVGSILIAVNPFKVIPIYQPSMNSIYKKKFDRLSDLPPHIFAIAAASYSQMLYKKENQVIVISGESGSGKTTSTSLILQHLSFLSQNVVISGVENILLNAGPVLEAFGNAKTKHNDNSSRFGKFIQIYYRENGMVNGAIVQKYLLEKSRIVSQSENERNYHAFYYLTEGASINERKEFRLKNACDYIYLNQKHRETQANATTVTTALPKNQTLQSSSSLKTLSHSVDSGVSSPSREAEGFNLLRKCMDIVGFSAEKQHKVFSIIAAVLHLGNVEFITKLKYNDDFVQVKDPTVVGTICDLLGLKYSTLLTALTTKKSRAARGETLTFSYKLHEAIATRDAMAKGLYAALFDWIVMRINQALLSKRENRDFKGNFIGILDIFGFEDFSDQNYFEQFCINFANEHLHYYFNQHVFKYEQEEYKREGIVWKDIHFVDNIECLKLIEERPNGLLCILDDQCNLKGASNQSMLASFAYQHKNNPLFEVPQRFRDAFIIKHYAGKVKYQITDFREKNTDLMRQDIVAVMKSSSSTFVRELVGSDPVAIFRWQILRAFLKAYFIFSKIRQASSLKSQQQKIFPFTNHSDDHNKQHQSSRNNSTSSIHDDKILQDAVSEKVIQKRTSINKIPSFRGRPEKSIYLLVTLKSLTSNHRLTSNYHSQLTRSNSAKRSPTVTAQFGTSLHQLLDILNHANPFFVRCIKSNKEKKADLFDDLCVLLQLRYTGMLETVRIRQSGYPVRLLYTEFARQYRIFLKKGVESSKDDIKNFLEKLDLNPDTYQMGETKLFMRESGKFQLDTKLHEEILRRIIRLQRWVRSRRQRRPTPIAPPRKSYSQPPSAPPPPPIPQPPSPGLASLASTPPKVLSNVPSVSTQIVSLSPAVISTTTTPVVLSSSSASNTWNVTRLQEFTDPRDVLITDVQELQGMYMFIFKKICRMEEQRRKTIKESTVDFVFKQALKEFRLNLLSMYSFASYDGRLRISYKDLIDHFEHVIKNICAQRRTWNSFPVIMGLNAFRGYLDEYRTLPARNKTLDKFVNNNRRRENLFMRRTNKRRMKEVVERNGHKMFLTIANIPTVCEICTSLVKLGSKMLVCNDCKLTCHKKCIENFTVSCRDSSLIAQGKKIFGAPLKRLVSEGERIPAVLELLMSTIEMKGLYVEGLYRKSATQSKINELKQRLEEDRHNVDLNQYNVHVWTAVFKAFFREMPEPLMTYQLYEEFLWATAIVDLEERSQVIFSHINKLSQANYDLLERLTFHLARVALVEHANKMTASSLAIVFAPCILRTDKVMRAQDSFDDIKKQTICLECIIDERIRQVKETLVDIRAKFTAKIRSRAR